MAINTRYPQVASPLAWGTITAIVLIFATAFAGTYWLLDNDSEGGKTTVVASASGIDDTIPVGAELSRPVLQTSATGSDSATVNTPRAFEQPRVVYMVSSGEHRQLMEVAELEGNLVRAQVGLAPIYGEYVVVPADFTDSFMAGMEEANLVRQTDGLEPMTVIDLR
ncbi:MAG: hypothetical protein KC482_03420 [Dehalococcoidia bacterium]|nr:hypothetical protein [Dehalococcoidia bacterium]MCA9852635.1 hypothetical protein [Dehalococcoidia bacterium]